MRFRDRSRGRSGTAKKKQFRRRKGKKLEIRARTNVRPGYKKKRTRDERKKRHDQKK